MILKVVDLITLVVNLFFQLNDLFLHHVFLFYGLFMCRFQIKLDVIQSELQFLHMHRKVLDMGLLLSYFRIQFKHIVLVLYYLLLFRTVDCGEFLL